MKSFKNTKRWLLMSVLFSLFLLVGVAKQAYSDDISSQQEDFPRSSDDSQTDSSVPTTDFINWDGGDNQDVVIQEESGGSGDVTSSVVSWQPLPEPGPYAQSDGYGASRGGRYWNPIKTAYDNYAGGGMDPAWSNECPDRGGDWWGCPGGYGGHEIYRLTGASHSASNYVDASKAVGFRRLKHLLTTESQGFGEEKSVRFWFSGYFQPESGSGSFTVTMTFYKANPDGSPGGSCGGGEGSISTSLGEIIVGVPQGAKYYDLIIMGNSGPAPFYFIGENEYPYIGGGTFDEWWGTYFGHHQRWRWGIFGSSGLNIGPKLSYEWFGDECSSASIQTTGSATVNLSNGNLFEDVPVIMTTGSGLTTNLTACYNSLDDYTGSLGKGWTHNYLINLTESGNTITLKDEDATRIKFLAGATDGSYTAESKFGDHSTIIKNPDGSYLLARKDGIKYHFNTAGQLIRIEGRNGNTQIFDYTDDNLTEITDSSGRSTTLAYADGKLTGITDPAGNTTTLQYTADSLTKVIDPGINTTTCTYDSNNRLISKTDPNGNTITYTYDEKSRVTTAKLNEESPIAISYDTTNNKAVVTDSKGNVSTYTYDPDLNTKTKLEDSQGNVTTYTFDEHRNLISTTDQAGNTSTYTYDTNGNLLALTDPQSNTTVYTYEPTYNQIASITDPQQNTTSYAYDGKGNLTAITDSNNQTTSYSYDQKGNLVSTVNPNGQATSFDYDQYGNLIKITDNSGNVTSFTYDASGNMLSRTDAEGNVFLFEYNALNQMTKTIDPKNNRTLFTYDGNGNRTSILDALGNTTRYEYNARNQLIKVIDAKGGITGYTYDANGNRISVTDANGNTTTYTYDSLNRLISETDSLGNTVAYTYDPKGKLLSRTDTKGVITTYVYDSLSRLIQTLYPDSLNVNYSYDSLGNLTHFNDNINNLLVDFTYDKLSRLTKLEIASFGAVSYEYDGLGNRTRMTDPQGGITTYSYDNLNRLIALTNPDNLTTTYQYDQLGRRTRMDYPNRTYTTYAYDSLGRLTTLTTSGREGVISAYGYTYDALGNRMSKKEGKETTYYQYDVLSQLTQARNSLGWQTEYEYDPVGNRTKLTTSFIHHFLKEYQDCGINLPEKIKEIAEVTYSYNSGNQLTREEEVVENRGILAKATEYGYDANGNQVLKYVTIGKGNKVKRECITSFDYDPENRLTGISYTGPDVFRKRFRKNAFAYCPFGKRIYKSDSSGESYYFYDGDNILLELGWDKKVLARYTTGLGIDEWISKKVYLGDRKGWKTLYYHYDGLGSVTSLTDERGKVVQRYNYTDFGTLVPQGIAPPYLAFVKGGREMFLPAAKTNTITYTGREYEPDSGLYYYRARYYDSRGGRFTSKDKLRQVSYSVSPRCPTCAGILTFVSPQIFYTPQQLHPYVYCQNNPIKYKDSTGLLSECEKFGQSPDVLKCQDCCDEICKLDFGGVINCDKICYSICLKGFCGPADSLRAELRRLLKRKDF